MNHFIKTSIPTHLSFSTLEFVGIKGGGGVQEIVVDDKLHGGGVKQINHGVQFSGKQCGAMAGRVLSLVPCRVCCASSRDKLETVLDCGRDLYPCFLFKGTMRGLLEKEEQITRT